MWFASDRHFWYWKWRTPSKAEAEKEVRSLLETKCKKRRNAVTFDCIVLLLVGRLVCSVFAGKRRFPVRFWWAGGRLGGGSRFLACFCNDWIVDCSVEGAVSTSISAVMGWFMVRVFISVRSCSDRLVHGSCFHIRFCNVRLVCGSRFHVHFCYDRVVHRFCNNRLVHGSCFHQCPFLHW